MEVHIKMQYILSCINGSSLFPDTSVKDSRLFEMGEISVIGEASPIFSNSRSKSSRAKIPWLAYHSYGYRFSKKLHKEVAVNCFKSLKLKEEK